MPRYGDSDYDPDYDDSPPPSPQRKLFQTIPPPSALRALGRRLWRVRSLILSFIAIAGLLYVWSTRSGSLLAVTHEPSLKYKNVDWKHYAYTQYATDSAHLCNAVMVFEALHRLGSKAGRILFYPDTMDIKVDNHRDRDSQLLVLAMQKYKVKLQPVPINQIKKAASSTPSLSLTEADQIGWDRSMGKLLAFDQTHLLKVIHLDNDITLYKHLDDLFLLPSATVAMARSYWLAQDPIPAPPGVETMPVSTKDSALLSPHLIVIEPSALESARIRAALNTASESPSETSLDVVIMNKLYKDTAMVLPHRGLALQTGEFRRAPNDHHAYLGHKSVAAPGAIDKNVPAPESWDPARILRETKLIHFAGDEPLPKPWLMWPKKLLKLIRPKCRLNDGTPAESECQDRELWTNIYEEFRLRRKNVCKVLSVPAMPWYPANGSEAVSEAMSTTPAAVES